MNIIVEVSAFRGNIHVLWKYPRSVEISTFRGYIRVPWILSAFRGNIHAPWILSARILPWLAMSPVLYTVHYPQYRTIHCSTVLPIVSNHPKEVLNAPPSRPPPHDTIKNTSLMLNVHPSLTPSHITIPVPVFQPINLPPSAPVSYTSRTHTSNELHHTLNLYIARCHMKKICEKVPPMPLPVTHLHH